jgi:hypothetical protein
MRRISFVAAAIATFLVVGLSAQKADLSGKWTLVPDPAAAAGGGGGGRGGGRGGGGFCGQECTITQDATTLTVTRTTQAGEQKATYKLDGSESKNPGRGGAEVVSKAAWEGPKIVIQTAQPGRDGGPPTNVKQTIGVTGGQMEVETDAGRGAQKQVYKKG